MMKKADMGIGVACDVKEVQRKSCRGMLLAVTTVLVCVGCALGPDYQRPETVRAEKYTRDAITTTVATSVPGGPAQTFQYGAAIPDAWWHLFESKTLNALVEQAFRHNPSIDSARSALKQARENVAAQRADYFPTLEAGYEPSRQKEAVGTISPTLESGEAVYTLHTGQLSLSYAPDVFGLGRRTVESLKPG